MILIPEQCYQKISIQNEDNVLITLFGGKHIKFSISKEEDFLEFLSHTFGG